MAVLSDPIADFITRLKNSAFAEKEEFVARHSKIKEQIAEILKQEGYIWGHEVIKTDKFPTIKVKNRFVDGKPIFLDVKRVSKPGRRQYVSSDNIPVVFSGLGIAILSTSKGLMTGAKARKQKLGGEVLAFIW